MGIPTASLSTIAFKEAAEGGFGGDTPFIYTAHPVVALMMMHSWDTSLARTLKQAGSCLMRSLTPLQNRQKKGLNLKRHRIKMKRVF